MSGLFGGPSMPAPAPMPATPQSTEKSSETAAQAEKVRLMRAMGRQSTLLSDQSSNNPSGGKKTTLGA